eukprot:TRINITY_DN7637_c0_g2_i1.p1 TRINITY_DN7637_c0_g2~~TRINITY_DN7637_c0_g2_i1.p1  ORF type:complete len:327 (+),score=27.06 TRINITY_DN7637_c0_g2_i1:2-982(+)
MRSTLTYLVILTLLGGCLCNDKVYRTIAEEPWQGYDAAAVARFVSAVEGVLAGLGLKVRVSVVCEERVCPDASCNRGYDFFTTNGCVITVSRHAKTLQAQRTYFEYVLEDSGTLTTPSLVTRLTTADTRLLSNPRPDYLIRTRSINGQPITLNSPRMADDDDSGLEWWAIMLIVLGALLFLLLLAILLYCLCCKKNDGDGKNRGNAERQPESGNGRTGRSRGYYGRERRAPLGPPPGVGSEPLPPLEPMSYGLKEVPPNLTTPFRIGDVVQAYYEDAWFPATVIGGSHNFGYDVEWEDTTVSYSIPPYHIRFASDNPNWVNTPTTK